MPAGIPICIAIIIHASARTYKICIIIIIVETRRAPPAGKRCLVVEVAYFGVTIIGHTETFVRVDAVVRRAKLDFLLAV